MEIVTVTETRCRCLLGCAGNRPLQLSSINLRIIPIELFITTFDSLTGARTAPLPSPRRTRMINDNSFYCHSAFFPFPFRSGPLRTIAIHSPGKYRSFTYVTPINRNAFFLVSISNRRDRSINHPIRSTFYFSLLHTAIGYVCICVALLGQLLRIRSPLLCRPTTFNSDEIITLLIINYFVKEIGRCDFLPKVFPLPDE